MLTCWEYQDLYEPTAEELSEAGRQGWEAYAVTVQHRSSHDMFDHSQREVEAYHFKRQKLPELRSAAEY